MPLTFFSSPDLQFSMPMKPFSNLIRVFTYLNMHFSIIEFLYSRYRLYFCSTLVAIEYSVVDLFEILTSCMINCTAELLTMLKLLI
jgi:type III secretory pathway component EscU